MTNTELYKQLSAAKDLSKELVEHFSYLADSDGFLPVLEAIMKQAKSVELSDEAELLAIHFGDDKELACSEATSGDFSGWPASYKKIMAKHEFITFPDDGGWALELGDLGSLEPEMFEDGDSDFLSLFTNPGDIQCPLTDYSDWWVYHPQAKNTQGEPMLCLASHESGDIEEYVACNIGSLFLKRVAEYLDLDNVIPNVAAQLPKKQEAKAPVAQPSGKEITDDDIYELFSAAEKATNVPAFIAKLEELYRSGNKLSTTGADYLVLYTSNIIVSCLNKELDAFPVFETLIRLFPNARRKRFCDQLCNNAGVFISAIKEHKEYYPQIKAAYMDGVIDDDNASGLYYIAVRLANMGLINEALVELKRVEESNASPTFTPVNPDDFPEEMKERVAEVRETLKNKFMQSLQAN